MGYVMILYDFNDFNILYIRLNNEMWLNFDISVLEMNK